MAEDPTRFYSPISRERMEFVPKVSGKGFKKPDIRDARREGWFPSVTAICKMWSSPALDIYKQNQLLQAAYDAPPAGDEPYEEWVKFIRQAADEHRLEAADFGTQVHAAIDAMFAGRLEKISKSEVEQASPIMDLYAERYSDWEMICDETPLVGRGYAGTCDKAFYDPTSGYLDVVDTKTQGATKDKKGQVRWKYYETWALQLASYKVALQMDIKDGSRIPTELSTYAAACERICDLPINRIRCVSLVQSSKGPWTVAHLWDDDYITKAYQTFSFMRQCWNFFQQHDPEQPQS